MFDSMNLSELFAAAEEIGAKYQSAEERAALARELAQAAARHTVTGVVTAWAALTSPRAVATYRAVLTVIAIVLAIVLIGSSIALTRLYRRIQPQVMTLCRQAPPTALTLYRRTRAAIPQAVLSQWVRDNLKPKF